MAKRRGTMSTVWSGWKCVKKMRSTARGSRPDRSMPRTAPEPRSKTSVSPPARTTTQLWRLLRRGTTVPDPTTVISTLRPSLVSSERPCEPCDAEQSAPEHVRRPVCPEIDSARGRCGQEYQDRDPTEPVRPQYIDGPEQEDRTQDMPAGIWIGGTHIEQRGIWSSHSFFRHGRLRHRYFDEDFDESCHDECYEELQCETPPSVHEQTGGQSERGNCDELDPACHGRNHSDRIQDPGGLPLRQFEY